MRQKNITRFFFIAFLLLALSAEFVQHVDRKDEKATVEYASEQLNMLERQMQQSLDAIVNFKTEEEFHEYFIHQGFQKLGISFLFYENGILTKWSDNETEYLDIFSDTLNQPALIHLANGWYEAFIKHQGLRKVTGLLLIKSEYSYENKYLLNRFNPKLGLPESAELTTNVSRGNWIQSVSGNKLFAVAFSHEQLNDGKFALQGWLYLFAFACLLAGLFFFFSQSNSFRFVHLLVLALFLFALRSAMIAWHLPGEVYFTDFFSPKYFASSYFFNSAGDLLLNALVLLCLSGLAYVYSKKKEIKTLHSSVHLFILTLVFAGMLLLMQTIHSLITSLIINSKISFDPGNIGDLNGYSLAGIVVVILLLWSYFFILHSFLYAMQPAMHGKKQFFISLIASTFVYFIVIFLLKSGQQEELAFFQTFPFFFGIALILVSSYIINENKKLTSNIGAYLVLIFAIYSSFTIRNYNSQKELDTRKLLAERLDIHQDPLAEYLFEDEERKISTDVFIKQYFLQNRNTTLAVNKRIQQIYFNGYWSKFDVTAYCFNRQDQPYDTSATALSLSYFKQQIEAQGKSTYCDKLFFMLNESGRLSYLAILPISEHDDSTALHGTVVLRLNARLIQSTEEGFPELFVSNRVHPNENETNYSYARYSNNALIYAYGNYPYSFTPALFNEKKNEFSTLSAEGYNHLIYRASPATLIIVSKPGETWLTTFSLFSYILFFFAVSFFIVYFLALIIRNKNNFSLNLKQRIRFSIIALVVISFTLIATGTIYYFANKYDRDQDKNILSRLNSLWFALNDNLNPATKLSEIKKEDWLSNLNQLANNLNIDFNLYDENGGLFYSSQPKIFEQGIISSRMNPEALFEMIKNGRTQYVHHENIGQLNYIAAYAPFTDSNGKITGYVNLPYFEKQNELNKEISGFLSALINIYMLLLAVAVLLALIISSRITKPLLLIQEKLSNIRLGMRNENIEWKRKDEIGELVQEYNRMVDELAVSADKLARSERETAWREMAKQVAHEIKNPLTPMKLSIQHLQRAWKENPGTSGTDMDELFQRISKTLVEQIDTLSNIAAEFSNFAQMPRPKNETLDLNAVLSSIIHLFSETPNVQIAFHHDSIQQNIFADREQIIRLFSNLLKNAIQAIPEGRAGKIEVQIKTNNSHHVISIHDNGSGIPQAQVERIFTPNFTTKTSGMGLGLAIVKSIAEQSGGRVWFETKEDEGTTFFVELRKG